MKRSNSLRFTFKSLLFVITTPTIVRRVTSIIGWMNNGVSNYLVLISQQAIQENKYLLYVLIRNALTEL